VEVALVVKLRARSSRPYCTPMGGRVGHVGHRRRRFAGGVPMAALVVERGARMMNVRGTNASAYGRPSRVRAASKRTRQVEAVTRLTVADHPAPAHSVHFQDGHAALLTITCSPAVGLSARLRGTCTPKFAGCEGGG